MSIHFLDAVIIGSVPLTLDLIDLGRDHEDFFEVWAVASEKSGRRVERLRHEAQRFRPTLKVNTGVVNCLDESGKSASADHVQCPLLQCRFDDKPMNLSNSFAGNRS
jgi:hypothetical protein